MMLKFVSFLVVFYSNAWCKVLLTDLTDDETLLDEEVSGDYGFGAEGSGQPIPQADTEADTEAVSFRFCISGYNLYLYLSTHLN